MTRKKLPLAITALIAGMFGSSAVHALGLGEIKIFSHLNEPLQAEVELVEVGDLNKEDIIAKLASEEVFEKAKIERDFFLTQIQFEVVLLPDGRGVLKLSTTKPAKEPYLDFILDAKWANGHLVKQYTLLLDPVTYSAAGAAPVVSSKEEITTDVVKTTEEIAQVDNQESSADQHSNQPRIPAGTDRYTTKTNDTLWRIASTHQASGLSAAQTMDAIYKLNPNAFIKNNINLLKIDKTLRLPSPEEVAYLAQGGDVEQLLNAQSQPQLSNEQADVSVPSSASEDKLKIVGSSSTDASTSAGTSESIDKIDRDNQDMNVRLAELTSQIQKMQQLIKMQDDQLSSLQQQLGGAPQKEEMKAAVEKLKSELTKVETEINKEPTQVVTTAQPTLSAVVTQAPTAKPTDLSAAQKPVQATATTESAEVPEEESSSLLVILGGLLLAVVGLFVVFSKNKRKVQTQVEQEADWSVDALRDEPSLAATLDTSTTDETSTQHETALDQEAIETQQQEAIDPLKEANQLVSSGNVDDAINVLKAAIVEQSTRLDLRTRLLELSAQTGDIETFEAQESYISRWGGAAAKKLAATLREEISSVSETSNTVNESALDFNLDTDSVLAEPETVVESAQQEDTTESIEHLFDELPAEAVTDATVDFNASDFETTLEEVAVTLPEVEETAEPQSTETIESSTGELSEKDSLDSFDNLFDDLSVEEEKASEIDFTAELGLLGDEQPATTDAASEIQADVSTEELIAPAAEIVEEVTTAESTPSPAAEQASTNEDDEFGFLAGADEAATKLDLAKAYIEMEDFEGAKDILQEVLQEGNEEQQKEAKDLLEIL